MTDFSEAKVLINSYEGAAQKIKILYNNEIYMLKFSERLEPTNNPDQASYKTSPLSEYIACHIFEQLGIPTQETILGTYQGRTVVACKDFIENQHNPNLTLIEFKKLENSFLGSSSAGGKTPLLENINEIFLHHEALGNLRSEAEKRYWQTFIGDALIGNFDRHAGNWGYILDKAKNEIISLAPVYDCGSSFYPKLNEQAMLDLIQNKEAMTERIKKFPTAALRIGRSKVKYHEFLVGEQGEKARQALKELLPHINIDNMTNLIQNTPLLSPIQKKFYTTLIQVRNEVILEPAIELIEQERQPKREEVSLLNEVRDSRASSRQLEKESWLQSSKTKMQNEPTK